MICTKCRTEANPRGWNATAELCWWCDIAILSDEGMERVRPDHKEEA